MNENIETATFGTGCFWCTEAIFEELNGVISATSGYSGGATENPTYKEVCGGQTGHAECLQIVYDPAKISFDELLEQASRQLDPANTKLPAANDIQMLVEAMYVLACSGEVTFQASRPNLTTTISDRPLASLLARKQSESDTLVTNLLHQSVRLEDEQACRILQLLDGTRSFEQLVARISQLHSITGSAEAGSSQESDQVVVSNMLKKFLKIASRLGLLVS